MHRMNELTDILWLSEAQHTCKLWRIFGQLFDLPFQSQMLLLRGCSFSFVSGISLLRLIGINKT